MQYSRWDNRNENSIRVSFNDTLTGVRMTGQFNHRADAKEALERCRMSANETRERLGLERTDRPD